MTRTIIKGRVKRCSRKDYPDHKFVVYDQAVGRTRPGVYERAVTVVGKIAFVWPGEGKSQADVLPALNVFDTREDANAFFTKGGAVRWIAHRNDHGVPEIFQARIRSFVERRFGRTGTRVVVVSRLDRKPAPISYNMVDYDTEAQAYRHFFSDVPKMIKEAEESIRRIQARRKALLKFRKRMRDLGVSRGHRKQGHL